MTARNRLGIGIACVVPLLFLSYLFEREHWTVSPFGVMLGSGLAAAVCSQAIVWWKEQSRDAEKAERERQFIALQLAIALERYAIECAMRISEIGQGIEDSYQTGSFASAIPGMPNLELPNAIEWRWISTDLSSEVLSLAPRIRFCEGSIRFTLDVAGAHDGATECQRQLGLIGHEAWMLAGRVREQHKISSQSYALGKWNFVDSLMKPCS